MLRGQGAGLGRAVVRFKWSLHLRCRTPRSRSAPAGKVGVCLTWTQKPEHVGFGAGNKPTEDCCGPSTLENPAAVFDDDDDDRSRHGRGRGDQQHCLRVGCIWNLFRKGNLSRGLNLIFHFQPDDEDVPRRLAACWVERSLNLLRKLPRRVIPVIMTILHPLTLLVMPMLGESGSRRMQLISRALQDLISITDNSRVIGLPPSMPTFSVPPTGVLQAGRGRTCSDGQTGASSEAAPPENVAR
ncbi:hypothetical protein CPLU01_13212 [Colletotrichum plurivorum]|uniref:Uncharacterized protein n=1 Tax=Colletotrichum plurivorum TaxID=2175906 RepID=A0A8H6JSX1_9PEZI|nr:hypothetical protein CPLU01_13212 [Colletotrichum plurivorum]